MSGLTEIQVGQLHQAVSVIAARCDGARDLDGQGFMKNDAGFGKMVAGIPPDLWDDDTATTVHAMLRKYRGQLDECGIDWDDLPVPAGKELRHSKYVIAAVTYDEANARLLFHYGYNPSVNDALKQIGAGWDHSVQRWWLPAAEVDKARKFAAQWDFSVARDVQKLRGTDFVNSLPAKGVVDADNGELVIQFRDYYRDLVAVVKEFPGRRYVGGAWRVPVWLKGDVLDFAAEHGLDVTDRVAELEDQKMPVSVSREGDYLVLRFRRHKPLNERLSEIPGARWSTPTGGWLCPVEEAKSLVDALVDCDLGDAGLDAIREAQATAEAIDASRALDVDDLPPIPGLRGGELRPFQRAGVAYALRARRTFIADDMGLGKTVQALATIEAANAYPAVICMPGFLKRNWAPEVRKWLPNRSVVMVHGRTPTPFGLFCPDIILVNYDILGVRPKDEDKPVWSVEETEPDGWTAELIALGPKAVVADESQYLRGHKSIRTIAATHLANAVPRPDGVVLALTGTPVVNQRVEAAAQIEYLGRLDEFGGSRAAVKRMGDLARRLRATCMVRRLKRDVEPELPARLYTPVVVDGDPAAMREYHRAEDDLLTYLADKARALALETGLDPEAEAFKARLRAGSAEHLVAVTVLKQLAAKARMKAVEQWVTNFLQTGKKLLVFAHHKTILHELGDKFGCPIIEGGVSADRRQAYVRMFQDDPDCKMLVIGITAGGAGLTLTAASDVLFVEQSWSPADHDQALDRCYGRLNDMHGAVGHVMTIDDTIDVDIAELIESKRAEVTNAVDGDRRSDEVEETAKPGSIFADLVVQLTEKALDRESA